MSTEGTPGFTPETPQKGQRADFYARVLYCCKFGKSSKSILKYFAADAKHLVDKKPSDLTFVVAVLKLLKNEDDQTKEMFITEAINSNKRLASEVGGPDQTPALHSAIRARKKEIVRALLKNGADVSLVDKKGRGSLHCAAETGELDIVKALIEGKDGPSSSALVSAQDSYGMTSIGEACRYGHSGVAEYLLRKFPDAGQRAGSGGRTPLHIAADSGHFCVMKMLLDFNVLVKDKITGETARFADAEGENTPSTDARAMFDINQKTVAGRTALNLACRRGDLSIVKLLLENHADPEILSKNGENCLWDAARTGHDKIVGFLLEKKDLADKINRLNSSGITLLSACCTAKSHTIVQQLLAKGADCTIANKDGSKPITEAILCCDLESLSILLGSPKFYENPLEALSYEVGGKRSTALHLACQRHDMKLIEFLVTKIRGFADIEQQQRDATERRLTAFESALDLLRKPPPFNERGQTLTVRLQYAGAQDQPPHFLNNYKVEILDLYKDQFIQHSASVNEALYSGDPSEMMKELWTRIDKLDENYGNEMDDGGLDSTRQHSHRSWLLCSGKEVIGRPERTGYMKPQCLMRNFERMPYVAPAWRCDALYKSSDYKALLDFYQDKETIIHGTRTLDEYFYHSCLDSRLTESIQALNDDQILGKNVRNDVDKDAYGFQVNVDQLWIWVLDEIVTSTTHRLDWEINPMGCAIVDSLRDAMGKIGEVPMDAYEMAAFIMTSCISSVDTHFPMTSLTSRDESLPRMEDVSALAEFACAIDQHSSRRDSSCSVPEHFRVNIKEAFNNAIAKLSISEIKLYNMFVGKENRKFPTLPSSRWQASMAEAPEDAVGVLSREIKDMRDELKILRLIAEKQKAVQAEFRRLAFPPNRHLPVRDMVQELLHMDKAAERIEASLNVTFALQHNAKAFEQARITVRQGRVMVVFTLVTIVFLPLSFFTSLFAMQFETSRTTPGWVYGIMYSKS
ncbi:hypothetical protein MY10362_006262 [Beauveria mimosiformis]